MTCKYCWTVNAHHHACPNNPDGRWQPVRPGYHGVVGIKRPKWGAFVDGRFIRGRGKVNPYPGEGVAVVKTAETQDTTQ